MVRLKGVQVKSMMGKEIYYMLPTGPKPVTMLNLTLRFFMCVIHFITNTPYTPIYRVSKDFALSDALSSF